MEVSISGHSNNYKTAAIRHVFEIYERNVIINVGPVTKVFDYKVWSSSINNSNILMNDNGTYVSGIASGQTFTGILDTTSYVIGKYTDFSTNFKWRTSSAENGYAIYDSSLNDVSDNYNLSYNLSVSITKAPISVTVDCPVLTYDAEEHSITVTVVDSVYGDVTYPKPKNYVIYYKVEGGTYTTNNPKFRLAGTYPVYVMVVADNYATLEFSNGSVGVDPNGNEITYNSYVQIDGVSFEGGYLDYAGRTEETNFYYCGSHYPTPMYIDSPSTGEQTVKYYTEDVYLLYRNALIAAEAEALAKSR